MRKIIIYSENTKQTELLAKTLGNKIESPLIIGLIGELGSGKTLFTKGIAKGLEINNNITSPTFTLLNIYHGKYNLHHFDLYRIKDFNEFKSLSLLDFLFENISIIEWFDKIEKSIKDVDIKIIFNIIDSNRRKIEFLFPAKNKKKNYKRLKEVLYEFSNNKT